jgi:hypothetical protein
MPAAATPLISARVSKVSALLVGLIGHLWPYLIAAVAGLGFLWSAYSKGKAAERAKQIAADAAAATEGQKIDDAVAGRAPDDNRKALGKWSKS